MDSPSLHTLVVVLEEDNLNLKKNITKMEKITKIKTSQLGLDGKIVEIEREPTQEEINEIDAILEAENQKRLDLYESHSNSQTISSIS